MTARGVRWIGTPPTNLPDTWPDRLQGHHPAASELEGGDRGLHTNRPRTGSHRRSRCANRTLAERYSRDSGEPAALERGGSDAAKERCHPGIGREKVEVPHYLFRANYVGDGVKGLMSEGGTSRRDAARVAIESVASASPLLSAHSVGNGSPGGGVTAWMSTRPARQDHYSEGRPRMPTTTGQTVSARPVPAGSGD